MLSSFMTWSVLILLSFCYLRVLLATSTTCSALVERSDSRSILSLFTITSSLTTTSLLTVSGSSLSSRLSSALRLGAEAADLEFALLELAALRLAFFGAAAIFSEVSILNLVGVSTSSFLVSCWGSTSLLTMLSLPWRWDFELCVDYMDLKQCYSLSFFKINYTTRNQITIY